jgi:S1-C subfamily serine protease
LVDGRKQPGAHSTRDSESPAERAKLDIGDVLVALAGDRLTFDNFTNRVHELRTDRDAELTVLRGGAITLELRPVVFR